MLDIVFKNGVSHFFCSLFIDKFGSVTAHKDNCVFACKFLLEKLKIWQDMQAVDAAVRPEVYEHELASQVLLHTERSRVEPDVMMRELLSPHLI